MRLAPKYASRDCTTVHTVNTAAPGAPSPGSRDPGFRSPVRIAGIAGSRQAATQPARLIIRFFIRVLLQLLYCAPPGDKNWTHAKN